MRKASLCLLPLLVLSLCSLAPASDKFKEEHTGKIPFVVGFEKGKAEAEWSGRPMMVFFTATW